MIAYPRYQMVKMVPSSNSFGPFVDGRTVSEGLIVFRDAIQKQRHVGSATYWRYAPADVLCSYSSITYPGGERVFVLFDHLSKWEACDGLTNPAAEHHDNHRARSSMLESQYLSRALSEERAGGSIIIDHVLPTIAITMSDGSKFFFQEHEASDLLDSVPDWVCADAYLLASAQNW